MTLLQIIAMCSCLACIVTKWIFSIKQSRMEHFLEIERASYKKARNKLNEIVQKRKILIHTKKQIEAKSAASQRNIGHLSKAQKKLVGQVKKDEELKIQQKEMISQLQNRG